jgi:mannose-6-phosphate isomerase-like protein (cupin superfamily)
LRAAHRRSWRTARDIAAIENATVRLHWTDTAYHWHVNEVPEVFVVLDGLVRMHFRNNGREDCVELTPGDVFRADAGDEHYAEPIGEARILVIEQRGSE